MKADAKMPLLSQLARLIFKNQFAWHLLIIGGSFLSGLLIWVNYGRIFDASSVVELWQARYHPATLYQWLLRPFALHSDFAAVVFISAIGALSFWLFDRISHSIGIGKKTFFTLFLLLNFSPEINQVRISADPYLIAILLWLGASWWFIRWYLKNLYVAFVGWALIMWFSAIFASTSVFWALGFPLCFIFWPGHERHWWKLLFERGKFLLAYYVLVALIILCVPTWRHGVMALAHAASTQFHQVTLEISPFVSGASNVTLSTGDAFFIALALVALNALKIAGVPVIIILWLSLRQHVSSVLTGRVKLFCTFMLVFAWILQALSLLYFGHLQSSRHYLPIIFLILWLVSGGAYYCVQKVTNGKLKPQYVLVFSWFLVAYALSSMLKFGPTLYFQRTAGQWVATQQAGGQVLSNSQIALYYANVSPLPDSQNLVPFSPETPALPQSSNPNDRYILVESLREPAPEHIPGWHILRTFSNHRNNAAYVLAPENRETP